MLRKYSDQEYIKAYKSLNEEQRNVLDYFIKTGYRTKWLHILATQKGLIKTEDELMSMSDEELNIIKNDLEWDLIDYVDYLKKNPDVRCECGRPLRHAYTIKHNTSKKVYVLGKDHFQQHTMIDPIEVKNIFKDFKIINLEKTELLNKVIEQKDFDMVKKINKNFDIPKDIVMQLEVNIPLLNRQIKRLNDSGAFSDYYDSIHKKSDIGKPKNQQVCIELKTNHLQNNSPEYFKSNVKSPVINLEEMMLKLESNTCTLDETEKFYAYFKFNSSKINQIEFERKRMKRALYSISSKLSAKSRFKRLIVEIGYLIFPDF